MKHLIYTAWMCLMLLTACQEHVKVIDKSLQIGSIYCTNGTVVPAEDFDGESDIPLGVIVGVGTEEDDWSALVMGLYDLPAEIYADSLYKVSSVSSDMTLFDGKDNTAGLLVEYEEEPMLQPMAALAATSYTEGGIGGWHLPSVAEMTQTVRHRMAVEYALSVAGGQTFADEWYHTSTADGTNEGTSAQYNYCIIMPEGRVVSSFKNEYHLIRPFLKIMKSGMSTTP